MVRIRFRRVGSRNQATFRIVAAEKEAPRDGRFLEILGHYNPRTEPATIVVDEARLFHWLKNGAQPSESVMQALKSFGAWDRWERYKAGEDLEALLNEAEAAVTEIDPRTRRDDLKKDRKTKSKKSKKAEAAAEAEEAPAAEETKPEQEAPEAVAEEKAPEAAAEEEAPEAEAEQEASEAAEEEATEAEAEAEAPAESEPEEAATEDEGSESES